MTQESIEIQIDYTDTMGVRKTVIKQVPLSAQSMTAGITISSGTTPGMRGSQIQQESFWSKYQWPLIIGVVLIAGYFWHRRKKK